MRGRADHRATLAAGMLGFTLTASAAFAADLAREHMLSLGTICGAEVAHCGWCYAAVPFGLAGASAFAAAVRPVLRRGRA